MNAIPRCLVKPMLIVGLVVGPAAAAAQQPYRVTQTPAELIAGFELEHQPKSLPGWRTSMLSSMLVHAGSYSPADVETVLDGLERLATTGSTEQMRSAAVFALATPSSRDAAAPRRGAIARLARIYHQSSESLVRAATVATAGSLVMDREAAVEFLSEVAATDHNDFVAQQALGSLLRQGELGRAALARLHDASQVSPPEARVMLEQMAKNDYRLPGEIRKP